MHFSVVIPAYNESATIRDIVCSALTYTPYVVVIDDGSNDNTAQLVKDLDITLIEHKENQGKAAALTDGIRASLDFGVDTVITMDADGQHKTEDIPRFINTAEQYPDEMIIGSRLWDKQAFPQNRYRANKFANFWVSWAAGQKIDDSQSGFRLYPTALLQEFDMQMDRNKRFVFESEIVIRAAHLGYRCRSIPIDAIYLEDARPSHFRGVTDILYITRMIAVKLILRGLYPVGLYRYLIKPYFKKTALYNLGSSSYLLLLITIVIMLSTGLLSLLFFFVRCLVFARSPCRSVSKGKLLVLGKCLLSEKPDNEYQQRLLRACTLFKSSPETEIIIVGGKTDASGVSESAAGKEFLVQHAVPPGSIHIEESSTHTLENFRLIYKRLKDEPQPVTLITNRYHLGRSHDMANGFSINHVLCGAEDNFRLSMPNILHLLSEAFFSHWYWTVKFIGKITGSQFILQHISNQPD